MWLCKRRSCAPLFPARIEPERRQSRRLKTAAQCTECDRKTVARAVDAAAELFAVSDPSTRSTLLISTRLERTRSM